MVTFELIEPAAYASLLTSLVAEYNLPFNITLGRTLVGRDTDTKELSYHKEITLSFREEYCELVQAVITFIRYCIYDSGGDNRQGTAYSESR